MVDFCSDDTPQLKAWRGEVRAFLEQALPGGMIFDFDYDEDDARWETYLAFWRKVGEKRGISLTWPTEYYGLGRSAIEKWILQEEFCAYGVPSYPVIGLAVAGAILRLGTPEQRRRHLKGIAEATVLWGEGYTEPNAGSDLAALTTRAHFDGEHWILNGQKTLGTASHRCQWMSVLARTDPNAKPHVGISCFLVPLDAPGVSMTPLHNMAGGQQNHTFFDNVRLPADCLLGDVNQAWSQVWFSAGGERLDSAGPSPDPWQMRILRMLNLVLQYCRETRRNGRPLSEDPVIRLQLAELVMGVEMIKLDTLEAYSDAMSRDFAGGRPARSSLTQAYFKEFWPRMAQICMEIVGPMAQIQGGRWAVLDGLVQQYFRASFGNHAGGTAQLKRMALATRGLGLPR
jgi:alkylation response protein AidB-like acyl-CoA dehydrogenase